MLSEGELLPKGLNRRLAQLRVNEHTGIFRFYVYGEHTLVILKIRRSTFRYLTLTT